MTHELASLFTEEDRQHLLLESIPHTVWLTDSQGRTVHASDSIKECYGYTPEELHEGGGDLFFGRIHPDDVERVKRIWSDLSEKGGSHELGFTIQRKDGEWIWMAGRVITKEEPGVEPHFLSILFDMTREKKVREARILSERRYTGYIESRQIGFAYHEVVVDDKGEPVDYRFIDVNEGFERLTGLGSQDIMGKKVTEVLPGIEEDPADWIGNYGRVALKGEEMRFEQYSEVLKRWYLVTAYCPMEGFFATVFEDITERVRAEEALRESEEKYRLLAENMTDAVIMQDLELNITYSSPSSLKMFGYSPEEAKELNMRDFLTEGSYRGVMQLYEKFKALVEEGREVDLSPIELECVRKDGSTFWGEVTNTMMKDQNGAYVGGLGVIRDITQRKLAEEALRESEEKFRVVTEQSLVGVAVMQDERLTYANEAVVQLLEYTAEELLELRRGGFLTLIHPEDRDLVMTQFRKRSACDPDVLSKYDLRVITKNGEMKWCTIHPAVVDLDGTPSTMVSLVDITERKRAEEALRESEEKFRVVTEQSLVGVLILQDERLTYVNEAVAQLIEYPAEELLQLPQGGFLTLIHPDCRDFVITQLRKRFASDPTVLPRYDIRVRTKSGEAKWCTIHPTVVDLEGTPATMVSLVDITDRKRAEEALRETEERFRTLVEQSPSAIEIYEPDGRLLNVNDAFSQLWGHETKEVPEFNILKDPESVRSGLATAFREALKGSSRILPEVLYDDSGSELGSGRKLWLSVKVYPIMDKEGQVHNIVVTYDDITERKQAEEDILRLSTAVRMTSDNVFVVDLEGVMVDANEAAARTFGFESAREFEGKPIFDLVVPEERGKLVSIHGELKTRGEIEPFETKVRTRGGDVLDLHMSGALMRDHKGAPMGAVTISRDITERKRAERKMREKFMKFTLEDGNVYLTLETGPDLSMEALSDLKKLGSQCYFLTRTPRNRLSPGVKSDFEVMWLSENGHEGSIHPDTDVLLDWFSRLMPRTAVLIDRFDYIITQMGFEGALRLVQRLGETAYIRDLIILLSLDLSTVDGKELRRLEKETSGIELREPPEIPAEYLDILKYVHEQNLDGLKPSYTAIAEGLRISRPTVRTRIRQLAKGGYVVEVQRGRLKTIDITEKGRAWF